MLSMAPVEQVALVPPEPEVSLPVVYPGVHQPSLAQHLDRCMISANILINRKSDFDVGSWMLDSGAFTRIAAGKPHMDASAYANLINRWRECGELESAVTQDMMCEPFIVRRTGLSVEEHQRISTANYLRLRDLVDSTYIMPVIQGWLPDQYAEHTLALSPYLAEGAWVGVGSVCRRQSSPSLIAAVLEAVHAERPDLRLHAFGLKTSSLRWGRVSKHLQSVDSMAWSWAARRRSLGGIEGPGANSIESCKMWLRCVESIQPK